MLCVVATLLVSNLGGYSFFHGLWERQFTISIGSFTIKHTLHYWVNDGLMAIFFLGAGLEIKRELVSGQLSSYSRASLPIVAAIGGMVVPALIYVVLNIGGDYQGGWAIPMATDIAFALGVINLLGTRVPAAAKTFLVALAIVDDIGAVLVIALYYTSGIEVSALVGAGACMAALIGLNLLNIRSVYIYFFIGILLWYFLSLSGVHATIAGVLLAATLPAKPLLNTEDFKRVTQGVLSVMVDGKERDQQELTQEAVQVIERNCELAQTPLQRLSALIDAPVSFFILPFFAIVNTTILVELDTIQSLITKPALGILFGLGLGKMIGISGAVLLTLKLGWAQLPKNTNMKLLLSVSILGGIGFTMSIFIAELAFSSPANIGALPVAKLSILLASLLTGLLGFFLLRKHPVDEELKAQPTIVDEVIDAIKKKEKL